MADGLLVLVQKVTDRITWRCRQAFLLLATLSLKHRNHRHQAARSLHSNSNSSLKVVSLDSHHSNSTHSSTLTNSRWS